MVKRPGFRILQLYSLILNCFRHHTVVCHRILKKYICFMKFVWKMYKVQQFLTIKMTSYSKEFQSRALAMQTRFWLRCLKMDKELSNLFGVFLTLPWIILPWHRNVLFFANLLRINENKYKTIPLILNTI